MKTSGTLFVVALAVLFVPAAVRHAEPAQPVPRVLSSESETAGSALVERTSGQDPDEEAEQPAARPAASNSIPIEPRRFLTGKPFDEALVRAISISWQERHLRSGLQQLSQSQEISILLDRRINPEQRLTLGLSKLSLQDVLATIATECDASLSVVGSTVYIGPAQTAAKLRTLVELRSRELAGAGAVAETKRCFELLRRSTLTWQDLDRPADLVSSICREAELRIEAAAGIPSLDSSATRPVNGIPHDLWAGAAIPHATVTEKLILILAQFDLSFEWQARATSIRLVSIPESPTLKRTWSNLSRSKRTRVSEILPQLKELNPQLDGTQFTATATVEQLEEIDQLIYPERNVERTVPRPAGGELRFTFEIRAQLSSLLKALPEKSDIRFNYDATALENAGINLDRGVEMKMQNASLEELCEALFKDNGIAWKIKGRTVTLSPEEKPRTP